MDDFGFRESPYATDHLPPSSEGEQLVGRDAELRQLRQLLRSSARHPTLEGENGVGKTSLVNVAGFQAQREFEEQKTEQLLIALERPFQLSNTDDAQSLRRTVFFEVARGFIRNHDLLKGAGLDVPDVGAIDTWLNTPVIRGGGAGASVAGFGVSGSRTQAPNTSAGFSEAGFDAAVDRWLRDAFPSRQAARLPQLMGTWIGRDRRVAAGIRDFVRLVRVCPRRGGRREARRLRRAVAR